MTTAPPIAARLHAALGNVRPGLVRLVSWAIDQLPEVLLFGGAGAVAYGAALVYRPAGWIVGGLLGIGLGWRLGRGQATETGAKRG